MTDNIITNQDNLEENIEDNKKPFKIPFITTTLNSRGLRGLPILYIDPSVKSTKCIRYGFIEGIGAVNIKTKPLNKFSEGVKTSHSTLKATELGLKFMELKGVNSAGEEVTVIIQEDLVPKLA